MTIDQILEGKPYEIQEIFHKLRRVLISLPQNIKEELCTKQGVKKCSYELNGKMIATLEPLKDHCILFLYQTDKVDIRNLKLQGREIHIKYMKIDKLSDSLFEDIANVIFQIAEFVDN